MSATSSPAWTPRSSDLPQGVEGGNGQLYMAQPLAKVFSTAEELAKKAGDSFVTVERLLLALAIEKSPRPPKILAKAGVTPQSLNAGDQRHPQGPHGRFGERRAGL